MPKLTWILPLAISSLFCNPTGLQVVSGEARLSSSNDGILQIETSDNSLLEWAEFSIGEGECTRFIQPSSSSTAVNRVIGLNCSKIDGLLESNGNLFLINHAGVLIGKSAQIHTESFFATAYTLDSQAFANRKIINEGKIFAKSEIDLAADSIENTGQICASKICLKASEILSRGEVRAFESNGQGGEILFSCKGNIEVYGPLFANGSQIGGKISLLSNSTTIHPLAALSAEGKEQGGKIILKSEQFCTQFGDLLAEGGFIEISGKEGFHLGGNIRPGSLERPGRLLLDPTDIDLGIGITTPPPFAYPPADMLFDRPGPFAFLHIPDLVSQLENGVSVTIQTNLGLGGMGRIRILSPILWNQGTNLSFISDEQIHVLADVINSGAGSISFAAMDDVIVQSSPLSRALVQTSSGNIQINALNLRLESLGDPAEISAPEGMISIGLAGNLTLQAGMINQTDSFARISGKNASINATESVSLTGGNSLRNSAEIRGIESLQMNIGNSLNLIGGSGMNATAVLSGGNSVILDIGLGTAITSGDGASAAIQSVYGTIQIDTGTSMPSDFNIQRGDISAMGNISLSSTGDFISTSGTFSTRGGLLSLTALGMADFSQNSSILSAQNIQIQADSILFDQSTVSGQTSLTAAGAIVFQNNSELGSPFSLNIQGGSLAFISSLVKGGGTHTFQISGATSFIGSSLFDFPRAFYSGGSFTSDLSMLLFADFFPSFNGDFGLQNGSQILVDTALSASCSSLTLNGSTLKAGQFALAVSAATSLTNSLLSAHGSSSLSGASLTMNASTIESSRSTLALSFSGNGSLIQSTIASHSDASASFGMLAMDGSTIQALGSSQTIALSAPSTLANDSQLIAGRLLTVTGTQLDVSSSSLTALNMNFSLMNGLSMTMNSEGFVPVSCQINAGMTCSFNLASFRAGQIILAAPTLQLVDSTITADQSYQIQSQNFSLMNASISDPYSTLQN